MTRRAPWAALALAAALTACAGGEEGRIRRELAEIHRLVAKTPAETELESLARARQIALHFTDPLTVVAEPVDVTTRDRRSLMGTVLQYRSRASTLYLRIYDEEVLVDESRRRARLTATVEFVRDLADLAGAERYAVTLHWVRVEDDWQIERAELESRDKTSGLGRPTPCERPCSSLLAGLHDGG